MRKLSILSILLIVGLVVVSSSAVVLAKQGQGQGQGGPSFDPPAPSEETDNTGTDEVYFAVDSYITLTVENSSTSLGNVDGDAGEVAFDDVNTLDVESNHSDGWTISTEVTSSDYTGSHLNVKLANGSWDGQFESDEASEKDINISYKLVNLGNLESGSYSATVTFTAATK